MNAFKSPPQTQAWQTLSRLASESPLKLAELMSDTQRSSDLTFEAAGLQLDASRQRVDAQVLQALHAWASEMGVMTQAQAMFSGQKVNITEQRAALHVALRGDAMSQPPWGTAIAGQVKAELDRFLAFAERARSGHWLGHEQQPITDVVNIGIGGSDLGPRMACQALCPPRATDGGRLRVHFVSNPDPLALQATLAGLSPSRTAFVVQSKSFTTPETLVMADSARRWLQDGACPPESMHLHLVAVTAKTKLAQAQGYGVEQTFTFWDWVGGRYSLWSAIGLPLAMAIGESAFRELLRGGREMDAHFMSAPVENNLPLTMALVGAWNNQFLGARNLHIAPYAFGLSLWVPFVQQLEMESNGKRTHLDGSPVAIATAPIVWGGLGMDGQHAYFQLMHQGTHITPVDFIGVLETDSSLPLARAQQDLVLGNLRAQAQALALGRDAEQTLKSLLAEGLSMDEARQVCMHRTYPGNTPSSILWLQRLTPRALGALVALYEHKVFCQSVLWGINPFDQWGVELGKTMWRQTLSAQGR